MNPPERFPGQSALVNAKEALRNGNRRQARNWASQAARANPTLEEPWLILAAVASPQASLKYLQHALKINPDSQRAQKGMLWALKRVQEESVDQTHPIHTSLSATQEVKIERAGLGVTQPIIRKKAPARPFQPATRSRKIITRVILSLLAFLAILLTGAAAWLGVSNLSSVRAWYASAPRPVSALQKYTLTVTASPTATETATPTLTSTPTATPTFTPSPTPTDEPTAPPTVTPEEVSKNVDGIDENRWIDVNLSEQRVYVFEADQIVNEFVVSTGTWQYPTITGQYRIYVKYLASDMKGPGYYLPNVPYVMYFYSGYGLHGTYWHNNFGVPMSHGCINLQTEDAKWLYNWANVGTLVNIHY